MFAILLLHAVLSGVVGLASLAAAGLGAAAAWQWRHDAARFRAMALGAVASLAVAVLVVIGLSGGGGRVDAQAFLRLLPYAGVPLLFLALRGSLRREERRARSERLSAPIHPVTGLPSRMALIELMKSALGHCRREGSPATVLVAEIDVAEAIEARHGLAAGREMLHDFAATLRETMRLGDVAGHASHGRLAVFLPGATDAGARRHAARLLAAVAARVSHPDMDGERISISMGIATVGEGPPAAVIEEALSEAEAALAAARSEGPGQVMVAPPPPSRTAAPAA